MHGSHDVAIDHFIEGGYNFSENKTEIQRLLHMEQAMADILVIDDCKVNRITLRFLFEQNEHCIVEAETGVEGERLFFADNHDIVFTDIFMPEQDGIQTIVNIRKVNKAVPIIAMSAGGSSRELDYLDHALKLGATLAFPKPITKEVYNDICEIIKNLGNTDNNRRE